MIEKIESALSFVSADCRETWLRMAMAIKSECDNFDIWDRWSQTSDKYRVADAKAVWRSVKASGGITIATLYKEASDAGWRDDGRFGIASAEEIAERTRHIRERDRKEAEERTESAHKAAKKAEWILSQCTLEQHAYIDGKGFPDMRAMVWRPSENDNLLCIPMRYQGKICGIQSVTTQGLKKFLRGQRTKGAEFVIGNHGPDIWCEGYATGLAIAACLRIPARVRVTFSAGNLKHMARTGYVIADNDASGVGEAAAKETGLRYFMPEEIGTDFNDLFCKIGKFRSSEILKKFLRSVA